MTETSLPSECRKCLPHCPTSAHLSSPSGKTVITYQQDQLLLSIDTAELDLFYSVYSYFIILRINSIRKLGLVTGIVVVVEGEED